MAGFGADGTRDFFSQPVPYSHDEGFDFYSDDAARTPVSTSVSRLGMEGLALNSQPEGWPNMTSYQSLLQSDGGSGSNSSRRPLRSPPPRRGTGGPIRTVGRRKPRGGGPSSSRGRGRGGGLPPSSAAPGGHSGPGCMTSLGSARHGGSDENELENDDDVQDIIQALDGQLDSSDEEVLNLLHDDAEHEKQVMESIFFFGMYHDTYVHKNKRRKAPESGEEWVMRNLADETECYKMFRMTPPMFYRLHDLLVQSYGLKSTSKSNSIEALGMFLWMVGAPQSVRQADNRLHRSLETVHRNFGKVLKCLVKLAADIIRPVDPDFKTIHRRLQSPRFRPHFNDCIGAIDGTHVEVVVPNDKMVQYLCRKGHTTQNVLAIVDFDMRFTFVLAGWPGSVHDMRVFNDATNKYKERFPHPPLGKYYLVDSGYPNRAGYLAPYKGTKYHLPEFRNSTMPRVVVGPVSVLYPDHRNPFPTRKAAGEVFFIDIPAEGDPAMNVWDNFGNHVFRCADRVYACVMLRSVDDANVVSAAVYYVDQLPGGAFTLVRTYNIGPFAVYLGANQALVLPASGSANQAGNTIYIKDGLNSSARVCALNIASGVTLSIPLPPVSGLLQGDYGRLVWVAPPPLNVPFWHCDTKMGF